MPDRLKESLEQASGFDLSDVRVHRDSPRPRRFGALASAEGSDIYLGPGQEKHLPHEAWHVVQQKAGKVKPTSRAGGLGINDSPALEREAEARGAEAMRSPEGGPGMQPLAAPPAPLAAPVAQFFRIGKIPTAGFLQNNVIAHDEYRALADNTQEHHDVADLQGDMYDDMLGANDTYFTAHAAAIALNPAPAPGHNYASDENAGQLWRQRELTGQIINVDHIVPYAEWGSNDFRNLRILSERENKGAGTSRPGANQFRVVSHDEFDDGAFSVDRQEILSVAKLNHLLSDADDAVPGAGDHDGKGYPIGAVTQMTAADFETIYNNLDQE